MPVMSKEQFVQAVIHRRAVKKKAEMDFVEFRSEVYRGILRKINYKGHGAWQRKGMMK